MDGIHFDTPFMKQTIGKIVKFILKKNGINLDQFILKELKVKHVQDKNVELDLSMHLQMTEDKFLALLMKLGIL